MPAQYYTLVTDIGLAKLANALALGLPVTLTHFAVGDGGGAAYDPVQSAKTLKREVYRAPINAISTDPAAPTWLTVEAVIPATVGGWTVREAGVFDADGDLIAIAKYPESVKPALDSGVGKDLYCRLILEHANVSAVTLKIDPSIVLATRKFVGDAVAAGIAEHKAAEGAHPDATTTTKGFVELATPAETKAGTSASLAVTPKGLADTLADRLSGALKRDVNTADLAAGYYITPLAIEVAGGIATPVFADRNLLTLAVAANVTLAMPATIPAGGGARIIATMAAPGNYALTLASGYRIIGGEFDGSSGAVNILDLVFGGGGGLIDVQITQRGAA